MAKHLHIDPVHLEAYISGDASGGISFLVYRAGVDITNTIVNGIGIVITDIDIITSAGGAILLTANADAAGNRIAGGLVAANSGIVRTLATHHYCPINTVPKIFGPATGDTRAILHGYLYKG